MPIDPQQAVGQEFTGGITEWRREDIVLYHLSLDQDSLTVLGVLDGPYHTVH